MDAPESGIVHEAKASLPESLTKVDVFAGLQRRVEAANPLERRPTDQKIPASEPLDLRCALRPATKQVVRVLHPCAVSRRVAKGADRSNALIGGQRLHSGRNPGACDLVIGIDEGQELTSGRLSAQVAQLTDS
jgi:hypothetical protein